MTNKFPDEFDCYQCVENLAAVALIIFEFKGRPIAGVVFDYDI